MTVIVLCLFLTVPWVGLQCMIVVFPDHTLLLFAIPKQVSMTRECHNHKPQTNPRHREEETHNIKSHMTARKQYIKAAVATFLFISEIIAKIEKPLSTALQNKDQAQNTHKNGEHQ